MLVVALVYIVTWWNGRGGIEASLGAVANWLPSVL